LVFFSVWGEKRGVSNCNVWNVFYCDNILDKQQLLIAKKKILAKYFAVVDRKQC
jgi:hypothetical protein